jgi:hypothetical protein
MSVDATAKAKPAARPKPPKGGGFDKGALFRLSRMLHAYLSAFAFLALIFFSVTGLLLNHPAWFAFDTRDSDVQATIAKADLDQAAKAADPNAALATLAARRVHPIGAYKSGEIIDDEANLRFEGVRGYSQVVVDMQTGEVEASNKKASAVSVINDLHRGKNAGKAWGLLIDLTAVIVLALSMIGYILFFSLRFRLVNSLILTAVSLAAIAAIFLWLVP